MTNVRRPKHLQLQRPGSGNHAMVSSASGPGPFGEHAGGLTQMSSIIASAPVNLGDGRPLAPARTPVIRPTALINMNNCHVQPPSSLTLSLSPSVTQARPALARSGAYLPSRPSPQPKALSPSGANDSLPSLIMPHLYVGNQEQTNRETVNKLNIKYILSLGLLPMISNTVNSQTNTCLTLSPPVIVGSHTSTSSSSTSMTTTTTNTTSNPISSPIAGQAPILMPSRNSSRDFKIRIRSNNSSTSPTRQPAASLTNSVAAPAAPAAPALPADSQLATTCHQLQVDKLNIPTRITTTTTTTSSSIGISTAAIATTNVERLHDENEGVKQVRSVYCKCINIADNSESSLSKFFDEAHAFIEEARRKKCNILIHCLAGISRSPTIAIAYLMRSRSLHWRDAYELVKQCRPQIDPNLNFMGQLRIYNRHLRDQQRRSSTTSGCKRASNSALASADYDQTSAIKSSKTSCGQGNNNKSLATSPMTPPALVTTAISLDNL